MSAKDLDQDIYKQLIKLQKSEITEFFLYRKLAKATRNSQNENVLQAIAKDELKHYRYWKSYTKKKVQPSLFGIFFYYWLSRLFGLTFGIKLMERKEVNAQKVYVFLANDFPEIQNVIDDENSHEQELISLIDEERLKYIGSVVLGLNDALVELTGTLAGLTFALQNTRLIALAGLIAGIAASFSMAASEYLSTKSEESEQNPLKSSLYTGIAYIFTVFFLVIPFLILENYYFCLAWTIVNAILIILVFNFYISVAKDLPFGKRFSEMTLISLGVAVLSFGVGYLVRIFLGIDL